MKTRLLALLIALAVPALSGCGNKGPLVLPQEPVLTEAPETTAPPTTDDTSPPADATATPPAQPVEPTPPEAPPADDGDDGSE